MMERNVNILEAHRQEEREEERRELQPWQWLPRTFFVIGIVLFASVVAAQAILIVPASIVPRPVARFQNTIATVFPFSLLPRAHSNFLQGELDDRVNVLVTGIGGASHDGPYLTDTILFASYQPSTNTVGILSIPRDLLVPDPPPAGQKINAVGASEEALMPGSGAPALAREVEKIFRVSIPYYLRVDFQGFETLIDRIGGIDVVVDRAFEDNRYPIIGNEKIKDLSRRYTTLKIDAGRQHFDGKTALMYARSRYGNNGEGSDFARMRRQQKVIAAFKEKLVRPSILRPRSLSALASLVRHHVTTNIGLLEVFRLQEILNDAPRVVAKSLDISHNGVLEEMRGIDGAYLLQPKGGNYQLLTDAAANLFRDGASLTNVEPTRVEVLNSTVAPGLAQRAADILQRDGFSVVRVSNAHVPAPLATTVVYDWSTGKSNDNRERLTVLIGGTLSKDIPEWLSENEQQAVIPAAHARINPDFTVVLGMDAVTGNE